LSVVFSLYAERRYVQSVSTSSNVSYRYFRVLKFASSLMLELGKFNRNYRKLVERWKNFRGRTRDDHSKFNRRVEDVTYQLTSSASLEH